MTYYKIALLHLHGGALLPGKYLYLFISQEVTFDAGRALPNGMDFATYLDYDETLVFL